MYLILISIFFSLLFSNYEKNLQTTLILAEPADTIHLGEGTIEIKGSLSMEGKENIVIKGNGIEKTILSFSNQTNGAEGLRINNCKNITMIDFTVQDSKGNHSVFIAFAPADNPKIALSVYVENAGAGGDWAAPIASLIMEKYLMGDVQQTDKELRVIRATYPFANAIK